MQSINGITEFKDKTTNGVTVVKFGAVWCSPCKRLDPMLEILAEEYNDKVSFYAVDIEQNKDLCIEKNVRSVPTTLVIKNSVIQDTIIGVEKPKLVSAINKALGE